MVQYFFDTYSTFLFNRWRGQSMESKDGDDAELSPDNRKAGGGKAGANGRSLKKYLHDKDSEEYKVRRQRNNVAVRKSRDRSRQRAVETQHRVQQLKMENQELENKVMLLSKELSLLKDLFLAHAREVPDPSTTFGLYTSAPDVASRLQGGVTNGNGGGDPVTEAPDGRLSPTMATDHTYVVVVNQEQVETEA